ncbi:hypothetical protein KIW84_061806 [Lathyrus oleraceus]|uniref:Retrovirus-related Pol polyprotein from transposon TNT 1-94-like beta-barrel domain-containing protein n=1 Tax=Pisum sativum TaxID=3888 RepID=A0A9D4W575_PEA|nr:hypothetical protein KIW84_061806 [Pisum sativum]
MYGYPTPVHPQTHYQPRPKQHRPINKKQWVPKANVTSLIAHIPLRILAKEEWYFDSGCSRHMTGNIDLIIDLHPHVISYVTFGDGAKGEIKGIGKLDCPGVPKLDNILLVKGLTANLISISQLCDQGLNVNFTKTECLISNKDSEEIMKGIRTKDNCYMCSSQIDYSLKCTYVKEERMKMSIDARGTLKSDERQVCGKCQTRMSHQKLRLNHTFKGEKVMMAQITERLDQIGGHVTSHMQSEIGESFVGTGPQGTMCLSQSKSAKNNVEKTEMESERTPAPTHLKDENGVYDENISDGSSCSELGWMKLLIIAYNVTHDVMTLYYDNLNTATMSKNHIQHS